MMNKKWIRPQILFPAVIVLTFAVVMCVSVFRPGQEDLLEIEKMERPGDMEIMWGSLGEEEFYQSMTIAVRATIEEKPEYFSIRWSPVSDKTDRVPMATYQFSVNEVLANAPLQDKITTGGVYKMSSLPRSFTSRGIKEGRSCILMLCDGRYGEDPFGEEYARQCFNALGYYVITPSHSLVSMRPDGSIWSSDLPEYLRGEGAFTTLEELREILRAGREKYGIPTLE